MGKTTSPTKHTSIFIVKKLKKVFQLQLTYAILVSGVQHSDETFL